MNEPTASLKRTPLFDEHIRLNGKMVPFAGYEMPVQYPTGIRAEHETVRSRVGIFDVSHMGEFRVRGPGAVAFASYATTNDPAGLVTGQVQYSTMCMPDGGVVDDLLVYRIGEEDLRLVVFAESQPIDTSTRVLADSGPADVVKKIAIRFQTGLGEKLFPGFCEN